jgi:hypothetical protein
LLAGKGMAILVTQFEPIVAGDGRVYSVQACGLQRDDGLWEGWLAFFDAAGRALRTGRETVQSSVSALEYWASGLTLVYLEGALARVEPAMPEDAVTGHADAARTARLRSNLAESDDDIAEADDDVAGSAGDIAESDGAVTGTDDVIAGRHDAAAGRDDTAGEMTGVAGATIDAASVADDAGHLLSVPVPLRGRVVAVDPALGRAKVRSGAHLLTVAAEPPRLDGVHVGQVVTITLPGI